MKKSTKIITTAIALVLVMGFMVVGIMAATSATASITAQVNWTATAGLQFNLYASVINSKEHNDYLVSKGSSLAEVDNDYYQIFEESQLDTKTLATVNTKTTNEAASGISATMNATFFDDSNDGVNNPRRIYYLYVISNEDYNDNLENNSNLIATITKIPRTTAAVRVTYYTEGSYTGGVPDVTGEYSTTVPTQFVAAKDTHGGAILAICLTIINPEVSLSGFDAGVSFNFSRTV